MKLDTYCDAVTGRLQPKPWRR